MPVKISKDKKGCFAQWGDQKKYYFKCGDEKAKQRAVNRVREQERVIRASGYK